MRKAGIRYLPQEQGEKQESYNIRLLRSLLFNTYVKVREGLLGIALKPKRKPQLPTSGAVGEDNTNTEVDKEINDGDIQLKDDVPPILRSHMEDIDLQGNHLDVFVKDFFRSVIDDGHAFILVDMQAPLTQSVATLSPEPTALDDALTNRRPYWVKYTKDQAINWKHDRINGETVLTQITFKLEDTESNGVYAEKVVTRYYVWRLQVIQPKTRKTPGIYGPVEWELQEETTVSDKQIALEVIDAGVTSLTRIPLSTVYARKTGLLESQPPLQDLAYLNVGHWQQWSDLNNQLRLLTPILVRQRPLDTQFLVDPDITTANAKKPEQVKIGVGTIVDTYGSDSKIYYVSHEGQIDQAREALMDLEQRMSAVGLSIISQKQDAKAQVTATEKIMDQGERESELSQWIRALKDGIELAMEIHAVDYLGLPTGGSIVLGFNEIDPAAVQPIPAPMPQNIPPQNAPMVQ